MVLCCTFKLCYYNFWSRPNCSAYHFTLPGWWNDGLRTRVLWAAGLWFLILLEGVFFSGRCIISGRELRARLVISPSQGDGSLKWVLGSSGLLVIALLFFQGEYLLISKADNYTNAIYFLRLFLLVVLSILSELHMLLCWVSSRYFSPCLFLFHLWLWILLECVPIGVWYVDTPTTLNHDSYESELRVVIVHLTRVLTLVYWRS